MRPDEGPLPSPIPPRCPTARWHASNPSRSSRSSSPTPRTEPGHPARGGERPRPAARHRAGRRPAVRRHRHARRRRPRAALGRRAAGLPAGGSGMGGGRRGGSAPGLRRGRRGRRLRPRRAAGGPPRRRPAGGVGAGLLNSIGIWAATAGLDALTLITFREVPWNQPYYERLGSGLYPTTTWAPDSGRSTTPSRPRASIQPGVCACAGLWPHLPRGEPITAAASPSAMSLRTA